MCLCHISMHIKNFVQIKQYSLFSSHISVFILMSMTVDITVCIFQFYMHLWTMLRPMMFKVTVSNNFYLADTFIG